MKMAIYTQDLMRGLSISTRGITAKAPNSALECVQIVATGNKVRMTGLDSVSSFTWEGNARVDEEGEVLMPGKLFSELARKLPGDQVRLDTNEKIASIVSGKSKSKLSVVTGTFPDVKGANGGYQFTVAQGALRRMISRTTICISSDETRLVLTGALLEVYPTEVRMVALDGFRMCINKTPGAYVLPAGQEKVTAVIPGKVLAELAKILEDNDNECLITVNGSRIEFSMDDVLVTIALLTGEYIDYEKLIPMEFKTEALLNTKATEDAVARASLMAREGKNNLIRMNFDGNTVRISSMADMGDVEEEADVDINGDAVKIAFNAKYLMELFRGIAEETVCIKMNGPTAPCIITGQDNDGWLMMLLPVRTF